LQTLAEVATENNSTLIFPIPVELLPLLHRAGDAATNGKSAAHGRSTGTNST
jgi:hypothetical protein